MKKILIIIIHFLKPHYFENLTYGKLEKWNIDDVINGKIFFKTNNK